MLSIRIVTAGAVLVIAVAGAGAQAQSAASTAPGKPISLLQVLEQPAKPKPNPHAKMAAKRATKTAAKTTRTAAGKKTQLASAGEYQTAIDAAPASLWPTGDTPSLAAGATEPAPEATLASAEPSLREIVVGGRTVQVASPNDVNAIDLAADDVNAATEMQNAIAASEAPSDSVTAFAREDDSEIPGQSWIAELLATLGGALAAGSVAWLLIRSAPQQRYS